MSEEQQQQQLLKKPLSKWRLPHVFIILFSIIVLAAVCTYIVPAGEYDRFENEEGRTVVAEGSYHTIESSPAAFFDIFQSIHTGMENSASIIFYIFIVGGSFGILRSTGAIEGAVHSITGKMRGKEHLLIPVLMAIFALGGAILGLAEETIPYITIIIPIVVMLGFDSMVGAAIVLVGTSVGFTTAFLNPFTIGVAQSIAELPLFSGIGLRLLILPVLLCTSIFYVMRYAKKIKENPEESLVYHETKQAYKSFSEDETVEFTLRHKIALAILFISLITLGIGVTQLGWYLTEISGFFLFMGIAMGLVTKMSPNEIAESFIEGCRMLVMGALVVGLAHAILVILQDGKILDTILYSLANAVGSLPSYMTAIGMYVVQCLINFVVPSGSGQAALTMPVMVPLGDLVGVARQTTVLAFQLGDGITNIFTPTSGYFMAGLALAGISWTKWVKWIWPLILTNTFVGVVFITIAHFIGSL